MNFVTFRQQRALLTRGPVRAGDTRIAPAANNATLTRNIQWTT
jgi:hypothetical protein